MGNVCAEERDGVPFGPRSSRRLKRWQGKSDKPVKKEAKPFQRDRQLEKTSQMGSSNVQWSWLLVSPEH